MVSVGGETFEVDDYGLSSIVTLIPSRLLNLY